MSRNRFLFASALTALLVLAGPVHAQGTKYADLLKRVPDGANVVALVDVDGLVNSPMGKRENWAQAVADRPDAVLGMGALKSKLVIATLLDLQTFEERWKLGIAGFRADLPPLAEIAKREGGYVEQIQNQDVVWTPRNFYVVAFPSKIAALAFPASRQLLAQWIKGTLVNPSSTVPAWLDRALFRAEHGSQIVLAVELIESASIAQTEAWLRTLEIVADGKYEPKILAPALASVKQAFLQIEVSQGIQGTLHIDFGQDIGPIKPIGKQLVLEVLASVGAEVDDLTKWTPTYSDTGMELSGPLELNSLRRILSVLGTPSLSSGHASGTPDQPPPTPDAQPSDQDIVKASQRYFRSVVDVVDSLKQQRNEKYSRVRFWLDRSAKQIDELPILNVDTDLLDWGAKVALTLREMSMSINYINKDKSYRLAASPKGSYYGWYGGGTWSSVDSRSTTTQANAMINVDATTRWTALQTVIGDMRRAMVQKYKVDF